MNDLTSLLRNTIATSEAHTELKTLLDSILEVDAPNGVVEKLSLVVGNTRIEQTEDSIAFIVGNDLMSFADLKRALVFVEYLRGVIPAPPSVIRGN